MHRQPQRHADFEADNFRVPAESISRVGVAGFDPSAVASKPKSLGVAAFVARDKKAVALRDLDGIKVQIGA